VRLATTAGGGIIGLVLSAVGALDFWVALSSTNADHTVYALEGAVWLTVGPAFVLVSVILIPAWHAIRADGPLRA